MRTWLGALAGVTLAACSQETSSPSSAMLAVAAGWQHTCALMGSATVRCWGATDFGQLGVGYDYAADGFHETAVTVKGLTGVTAIAAGFHFTCALVRDGTVRCWGIDGLGQLGDGPTSDFYRPLPVPVSGLDGVAAIGAGADMACAVMRDATVRCWGTRGAFVSLPLRPDRTPVVVSGLEGAVEVAVGMYHACALLSDRTVRCWGSNWAGELGDGTTTDRATPVPVAGLSDVVSIAAGFRHTCARLADGTVQCWGVNEWGQLGDGTTGGSRTTPVAVGGLSGATSIAAGQHHTCASLDDGTARCWGGGWTGQRGDGTTTSGAPTPVEVSTLSGAKSVAAGQYHGCAVLADRSVRCWGLNDRGQLGDGTRTDRTSPVTVLSDG